MATNFSNLQTIPPDNSTAAGKNDWYSQHPTLDHHLPGMIVLFIGFFVVVVLFLVIGLRDHYIRKYGYDIFDRWGQTWRQWRQNNDQVESDRALAEELQRRLNEDEREAERLAKRKEREEWYSMYIKDFTMTAKAEDLFYAHESSPLSSPPSPSETTVSETSVVEKSEIVTRKRFLSTASSLEEDFEDVEDLECGAPTPTVHDPIVCNQDEEDAHLFLRLPVKGTDGHCRTVDAQCAICFSDYEPGDEIVWSGLQCQHAFHRDCILPWLGKGKKRCPMCRHWFVPGAKIEDQKKALEERLRREAENNTDSEIANEAQDETRVAAESPAHQKFSTTEIPSGDADATSTTEEDTTAEPPSSSMSLDSGHESDESDHNHCHSNPSDPTENKDTSLRGRCETEEVTSEIYNHSIEAV